MAAEITMTVRKISKEKSWQTDAKGKPLNRTEIEFEVGYMDVPEPAKGADKYSGSTMTLSTKDDKIASSFKIGDEYTISLKKAK